MVDGIEFDVVWNGGPLLMERAECCPTRVLMIEAPGCGWGRVTRERPKRNHHMRGSSKFDMRHAIKEN
jgi:hypothetical protein